MNRGIGILILALLAGCVRFHPQPLSPAKNLADWESRSLTNTALKGFAEKQIQHELTNWPPRSWDLDMLTLAAFYYHPDLDVARAQWAVAEAGMVTAGERPNPTLYLLPGYDTTTAIPSPWLPLGQLDIPIETAGKRGYRIAEAKAMSKAARLNIASAAWHVRSGVRQSLLALNAAREQQTLLRAQQVLEVENLGLVENQYKAGAISAFERTQAGLAANTARLALRDAEQQSADARAQLADAIGLSACALDGVDLSPGGLNESRLGMSSAEARRRALFNRADILSALAEYAASQSALQLEIAKQYPDVHIGPGYQYNQGDNQWLLGITVTLPVLNQNKGAIGEAQARRAEAAARFNALQAKVLSDIERAEAVFRVALLRKTDTDEVRARLEEQEKSARAMFEAGEISKAELTALRLQLMASDLARLDALVKSQQALGQLEDALQSPLGLPATAWQNAPRKSESGGNQVQP